MGELEAIFDLYGFYLWGALFALVLLIGFWTALVHLRLARLTRSIGQLVEGADSGNLEEALERHFGFLEDLMRKHEDLAANQRELEQAFQRAVQHVGIVRFNPFGDTGGDQSFSVALLDAHRNGVVLSSLFSRTGTRVFAKPVHRGQSRYTLTEEEQQAIVASNGATVSSRAE